MQESAAAVATLPHPVPLRPDAGLWFRRVLVFGPAGLLTAAAGVLMGDLLWRLYGTYNGALLLLLLLFLALFGLLSLGVMTALAGFCVTVLRLPGINLSRALTPADLEQPFGRTAVVYPVFNEPAAEVFARVRAVYRSLERTGRLGDYEFFILSDSTDPDRQIQEEYAWAALCREFDAFGRIFYRRRTQNTNKKAGNIADFCQTWGGRYAYMLVMDADSVMSGRDIVKLTALMEKHPRTGLLQTSPRLVHAESLYGRLQQFANRFYGDIFAAGIHFWQGRDGNYWGHNALIRLDPFTKFCALPDLPGREPFGGKILSHDFVEAALMRRAGWEVWLVWELEGTYEEGPPSLVDSAKRDRRWLQGNLQHTWLVFAGGLHVMSRLHLLLGILGYLASAFWFLFLLVSSLVTINYRLTGLTLVPAESNLARFVSFTTVQQGLVIFGATLVMLFMPKILALLQCLTDWKRLHGFGGLVPLLCGLVLETLFSSLTAPLVMLFHSRFLLWMLLGRKVEWVAQQRGALGTGWKEALVTHGWQSLLGAAWLSAAFLLDPVLGWWLTPVWGPVLFAIPISVWSSQPGPGQAFRRLRILLTPEELSSPQELREAAESASPENGILSGRFAEGTALEGITRVMVDPYVNAVHVSSLEAGQKGPEPGPEVLAAGERLMVDGPEALTLPELRAVTSHVDLVLDLHRRIWLTPFGELSPWWQRAVERYRQ